MSTDPTGRTGHPANEDASDDAGHAASDAPADAEAGARPGEPDPARVWGAESRHADELTLPAAQAAVDAWIGRFEEGYWPPLANLARLAEEVGELARELNHRYGSKPKKPDEPEADLALELGDILFVLLALANEQGIDLDAALRRVLEKYEVRDRDRWTPR